VNVASGFRQAQWLQIVKSAKRSEKARPNFNQVFRASMSVCPSISLSTVSTAYFWRIFEKSQLPAVGNGPRNFKSFYHEIAAWNSVINDRGTQRQSYLWYYRPNGNFRSFSPWGHANYQNTSISTPFRRQVTEFSVLSPIYRMTSHPVRRRHAGIGTSNRIGIRS
jgi:hypothetical protein